MTPSARRSSPAGSGSVIGAMPLAVVVGTMLVALVAAISQGGWVWAVPAVVWGAAALWLAVVLWTDGRTEERAAAEGRSPSAGAATEGDGGRRAVVRARLAPALAVVVVGVAGFCACVALLLSTR